MKNEIKRIIIVLCASSSILLYGAMRQSDTVLDIIKYLCKSGVASAIFLLFIYVCRCLIPNSSSIDFKMHEKIFIAFYSFFLSFNNRFIAVDTLNFGVLEFVLIIITGSGLYYISIYAINQIRNIVSASHEYLPVNNISIRKIYLTIVALYIPYIIIFFPGSVSWDGSYQINEYIGMVEFNDGHPILTTLIAGFLVDNLNGELGIFIYSIMQLMIWIYVLSFGIKMIAEYIPQKRLAVFTLILMIIIPIPLSFNYVLIKDGFYASFVSLFSLLILKNMLEGDSVWDSKCFIIEFIISSMGMLFFRLNGIYVLVGTSIIYVIKNKQWKRITIYLVGCLAIFYVGSGFLEDASGVKKVDSVGFYSLPLQQMTRYYQYYSDELSEKELDIINQMVDIDNAAIVYDKMLSDPVGAYYKRPDKKNRLLFMQLWFDKLLEHPVVYIEAFLGNAGSYFDPTGPIISDRGFFTIQSIGEHDGYSFEYTLRPLEGIRKVIGMIYGNGDLIPVLGLFYHPGLYFILLIGITCVYLRYNKSIVKALVPLYISFLVCIASPVNGSIRYMLPIIECVPIMFCLCGSKKLQNIKFID